MRKLRKMFIYALVFTLCIGAVPRSASAEEYITNVMIQTYPDANYGVGQNMGPIVGQEASVFQVKTTSPVTITSAYLTDAAGNTATGKITYQTYTLHVSVTANDGNFMNENTVCSVNNSTQTIYVSGDGRTADITASIDSIPLAPTVWHNPTDETHAVGDGQAFSFSASCGNYDKFQWYLVDPYPEAKQYKAEQANAIFDGMTGTVTKLENGSVRFNLHNVPEGMNGWGVYCLFESDGGAAKTTTAYLHVKPDPNSTPAPVGVLTLGPDGKPVDPNAASNIEIVEEPTPTIEIVEEPEPSIEIVEEPVIEETPAPAAATPTPVEQKEKRSAPNILKWLGLGIVGLVVLGVGIVFIQYVRQEKKRKRRKKMAGRSIDTRRKY